MTLRHVVVTSITVLVIGLGIWWLLHPVCRPLSEADVREFARWAPIDAAGRHLYDKLAKNLGFIVYSHEV